MPALNAYAFAVTVTTIGDPGVTVPELGEMLTHGDPETTEALKVRLPLPEFCTVMPCCRGAFKLAGPLKLTTLGATVSVGDAGAVTRMKLRLL